MQEKLWAVVKTNGSLISQVELFDSESDADHFAEEMKATDGGNYQIVETMLNRRDEVISGEPVWTELTSFDTNCVECLIADIDTEAAKQADPEACAQFLEEHKEELQKKANEIVREYIRKTVNDYVNDERIILG